MRSSVRICLSVDRGLSHGIVLPTGPQLPRGSVETTPADMTPVSASHCQRVKDAVPADAPTLGRFAYA